MTITALTVQKVQHTITPRLLTVCRVTQLTPSMRRITLTGPDLEGFMSPSFEDHVKLFLPASPGAKPVMPTVGAKGLAFPEDEPRPVSRDYTPRRYDPATQELDIDFVLNHQGPATDWAALAKPGDYLGIGGPRGSFLIPKEFDWHLLIGDETALPAIGRRLAELPEDKQAIVVVKTRTAEGKLHFETRCRLTIQWVVDDANPAQGGTDPLEQAVRDVKLPQGDGFAWAAGEYTDIKRIREYLVNEQGLDKSRVRAASYWRKAAAATHVNFD
jgi:NADPH-dependent ferric siderophore reductase